MGWGQQIWAPFTERTTGLLHECVWLYRITFCFTVAAFAHNASLGDVYRQKENMTAHPYILN